MACERCPPFEGPRRTFWVLLVLLFLLPFSSRSIPDPLGGATDSFEGNVPTIRIIREKSLFTSEPDPARFGNPRNPKPGSPEAQQWSNQTHNWLKSRFHFTFAEYRNGPRNFGPLRVANDDLVQPKRGFGTHQHANVEIVTYIVSGNLTHKVGASVAACFANG